MSCAEAASSFTHWRKTMQRKMFISKMLRDCGVVGKATINTSLISARTFNAVGRALKTGYIDTFGRAYDLATVVAKHYGRRLQTMPYWALPIPRPADMPDKQRALELIHAAIAHRRCVQTEDHILYITTLEQQERELLLWMDGRSQYQKNVEYWLTWRYGWHKEDAEALARSLAVPTGIEWKRDMVIEVPL